MARNGNQKSQLGTSAQRHETDLMRGQRTVSKRMGPILGTRAKGMSFSTNRNHSDMWRSRDKAS
jgi:hypothetical protein